jgi:hypothetical protein
LAGGATQLRELLRQRLLQTERERSEIDIDVLKAEIDLLGRDNVARSSFLAELAKMKVPEIVVGNAESLLDYMSLEFAHELIARMLDRHTTPRIDQDSQFDSGTQNNREQEY